MKIAQWLASGLASRFDVSRAAGEVQSLPLAESVFWGPMANAERAGAT
jgi:hypothetical protein